MRLVKDRVICQVSDSLGLHEESTSQQTHHCLCLSTLPLEYGQVAMVSIYNRNDLHFCYPDNWQTTDEVWSGAPPTISVQSPGTGFWSVTVYPPATATETVAAEALRAMREEYPDIEFETLDADEQLGEETFGYDLHFFCLDMVVRARIIGFRAIGHTFLTQCQAEDDEFSELEEVFRAITLSLTQQLEQPTNRLESE